MCFELKHRVLDGFGIASDGRLNHSTEQGHDCCVLMRVGKPLRILEVLGAEKADGSSRVIWCEWNDYYIDV